MTTKVSPGTSDAKAVEDVDPQSLLSTLAAHDVAYVLDGYGEPVYGPAVSAEGVRVIPKPDKNNMKALAAALTQLDARLDPNRPSGQGSEIKAKPLAGMLEGSWYLRFHTDNGGLELLHDYTHKAAGVVAPRLLSGEGVVAAVPVERAGKQKNADLYMKTGALAGNLLRRKKAQAAAAQVDFPDASAMVLVATTHRVAAFQQDARTRFTTAGVGLPGDHVGDVAYERLAQVEAGKPQTVSAGIQRAGYLGFAFRDGNTHVLSAWGGGGPLFATAVNVLAGRVSSS